MVPDIVAKQIAKAFGEKIGGPLYGALSVESVLLGIFVRETVTLVEHLVVGAATPTDIRSATVAFESIALGAGVILIEGGVIGGIGTIAGVTASIPLTAIVIGIAGACVLYEKKGSAINDAVDVLWDGISKGDQPWNIFPAVFDAYSKESKRINDKANTDFLAAKTWVAPRDPLVSDLDGDGIEAIGIDPSAPILFDHDGGGVKTATGWIKADDGILALDRDGNGLIDSGRELFGDATVMSNGQKAANGYEALADLDGNADGVINNADAAWGQLRVWRDLNQDGISQAGELKTLAELGIASLGATGQAVSVSLGGGNTQTMSGTFTKTDGSAGQSASLQLASNNFYREFTDEVALTAEAQALPQMQGSGLVRDLQEAMSLGTAQALALQGDMAAFAAAKKWDDDATKSIAGCARRSSAKGRFYAQQRVCGRRKLTRSDWMSAASRNLRPAFDARAA